MNPVTPDRPPRAAPPSPRPMPPAAAGLLDRVLGLGLVSPEECEVFLEGRFERLRECASADRLGVALVQAGLLTSYQLERVLEERTHGLLLGQYRVLDEIGRGGMGVVYLAEHHLLRRRVAVKVVTADEGLHYSIRQRFYAEMRVLAELSHPNVVLVLDGGEVPSCGTDPPLMYMVMEVLEGGDLERQVVRKGVCGIVQACGYARQAASGLQAAHDRHLIHRDLKPSNLLLTRAGQVKLVDFGLARQFCSRLTDQRALLGSLEFMPPEQSYDPSAVGKEADVYGLGATLFWLLTGEGPYPYARNAAQALRQVQQHPPRRLRELRADAPPALDDLLARMLARSPGDRPASMLAVMNALRPFLLDGTETLTGRRRGPSEDVSLPRALVVGADEATRALLERAGCECGEAADGDAAMDLAARNRYDLVLLGREDEGVCVRLRDQAGAAHLKVLVVCDEEGPVPPGADVVVASASKPLLASVRHALALKTAEDRASRLADQLMAQSQQLEAGSRARQEALDEAHDALLFTVAKLAESRDGETPGHLERMKAYVRALAMEAAKASPWRGLIEARYLRQLERCVPLHDVGKIGLPEGLLTKPASLSPAEREVVQTHAVLGDQLLETLAQEHGAGLDFLGLARALVRHHHERWDGGGYPDGLAGEAIPPAARIVAVADVYDALRRQRLYKPAMAHQAAVGLILRESQGQFDPTLLAALERCHGEFERIYREIED